MKKIRIISLFLAILMLFSALSLTAFADNDDADDNAAPAQQWASNIKIQKISNPNSGEREVDGLIAGGDRENSYTWRLAMRGDEIYIATTRNIASALVNMYAGEFAKAGVTPDTLWGLINIVTNGDIPRSDKNEGANIISYNRKTSEFKVIYTADDGDYFRMAVTFGDDVYFGSYSAVPTNPQYILKLDPDGNFTKVFQTMNSVSLRANCEYEGHLFFAGADDRTPVPDGETAPVAKMAVLRKSNDDDAVWERVADYKDFGDTAFDPIHTSWAGAPIWELANHDGHIYATAPTHAGFVIYKGRPAKDGEDANEYGWIWTEVAGPTNGINNPGLSDVEGGEPGTVRSLIGSVYEFNGELYAYNFDHSFGGEASAFAGFLQQAAGKDVKASDYLYYLYNSLQNPQKIWKLNDETGKFEECTAFTELTEGTTNEYVWRMGEHNGELYIATMDAGIFYNYLTQLTNGSFILMSNEERLQQIGYLTDMIKTIAAAKMNEKLNELKTKLEELKTKLMYFALTELVNENTIKVIAEYLPLLSEIKSLAAQTIEDIKASDIGAIYNYLFGNKEEDGEELAATAASPELAEVSAIIHLLPGDYLNDMIAKIKTATDNNWNELKDFLLNQIKIALVNTVNRIITEADNLYNKIDGKGIEMYLTINRMVHDDDWGFDMFRTEDGENFEIITRDGFGDKYNYGCSAFLSTEEGMYCGTCNPFYGGQLYLLTENEENPEPATEDSTDAKDSVIVGDADGDKTVTVYDATTIQRALSGIDVEINEEGADADLDESITVFDATAIQRWLAGIPGTEQIGKPKKPASPAADIPGMKTMSEVLTAYPDIPYEAFDGVFTCIVNTEDHIYRIKGKVSDSDYDALINLNYSNPEYNQKMLALLANVPVTSCEDIKPQIIPQDELDKLVGKSGQELMDMGFVAESSCQGEGDTLTVTFVKGAFTYDFTFNEKADFEAENFNVEEVCKTMTVVSATYYGISNNAY